MKDDFINNVNDFNSILINSFIKENFICLDATVGNGNDTLKILRALNGTGKIYGLDIQFNAIESTKALLASESSETEVILINDNHEFLDKYIHEKLNFIIYNLGYLPGGNKEIKTEADSTLNSLKKSIDLLSDKGLILITVYLSHPGGMDEYRTIINYLSELNQRKYNVFKLQFINQKNNPPITIGVEARGGE